MFVELSILYSRIMLLLFLQPQINYLTYWGRRNFVNFLRKSNVNWVNIPPYAPNQGGSWKSMVKLFKNALSRVLGESRRKPTLIELQTFFSDAVRIVNDRPLTTSSD